MRGVMIEPRVLHHKTRRVDGVVRAVVCRATFRLSALRDAPKITEMLCSGTERRYGVLSDRCVASNSPDSRLPRSS